MNENRKTTDCGSPDKNCGGSTNRSSHSAKDCNCSAQDCGGNSSMSKSNGEKSCSDKMCRGSASQSKSEKNCGSKNCSCDSCGSSKMKMEAAEESEPSVNRYKCKNCGTIHEGDAPKSCKKCDCCDFRKI